MPEILLTCYFLLAQGHMINENVIMQENQSAELLEKNTKPLSSKQTNHINIFYSFITHRIKKVEVNIAWFPTLEMTGYFMTKPLQEILLRKF